MSDLHIEIDQQPQRPDPGHGKSVTQLGIFFVFVELLGAAFLLALGVRFFTAPEQPDAVAWVAFVLTALLLVDFGRRLIRIARGRSRR